MHNTVNQFKCNKPTGEAAIFERMPKSTPNAMAEYTNNNSNAVAKLSNFKKKQQFFEHDTRNNTELYAQAAPQKRKYIANRLQRFHTNGSGGKLSNKADSTVALYSDSVVQSNAIINSKLKKKLFKIQRKLRLQTFALKQQQRQLHTSLVAPCCCNRLHSNESAANFGGHIESNKMQKFENFYDCNIQHKLQMSSSSSSGGLHGHGLRSVVR